MSAPLPADLDRIDPQQAWEAWEPEPRDPWNSRWAGHLFRRAAFGASPERIASAVAAGLGPTLAGLLDPRPGREDETLLNDAGQRFAASDAIDKVRGWWIYAMLQGGHPLREKLTLFWHNHFATSVAKVKS